MKVAIRKARRGGRSIRPDQERKHVEPLIRTTRMEGLIVTLWPNTNFGRVYSHEGEEIRMVLEGELEIDVDGKCYRLKKGEVLWHSSELPHALRNPGKKRVRYLVVAVPPSRM
ncbi:MAG: cupin domain-containing protein [Thermoplasmata archaeon]